MVEAEGAGDDAGGNGEDELTQCGDARGAQRQAMVAELGDQDRGQPAIGVDRDPGPGDGPGRDRQAGPGR